MDIAIQLWPHSLRSPGSRRHVDRTHRQRSATPQTLRRCLAGLEISHGRLLAIDTRLALFLMVQTVETRRAARGTKLDPHRPAGAALYCFALDRNGRARGKEDCQDGTKYFDALHGVILSAHGALDHGGLCSGVCRLEIGSGGDAASTLKNGGPSRPTAGWPCANAVWLANAS